MHPSATINYHAWGLLVWRVTAGCKLASVLQSPVVMVNAQADAQPHHVRPSQKPSRRSAPATINP